MGKLNCWEYKRCGRGFGGGKVHELGICPAATNKELDGIHSGRNAGRACWVIAGSMCGTEMMCPDARKMQNCRRCDFMNVVKASEERGESGFFATRLEMDRALQTDRTKNLFACTAPEGLSPEDVHEQVSPEHIDLVKSTAQKMLGPKSARFIAKIDELHAQYGERCCNRIEELDEVAQIFYGKLVAKNLREEINRIVRGSME